MTEVYLMSISTDELKSLIQEAVHDALTKSKIVRERLPKRQVCKRLGVSFNTLQKMLLVTGRDYVYADEINEFKQEYELKKSLYV